LGAEFSPHIFTTPTEHNMQTFIPQSSFVKSAACLDMKRLGKQRVECLQILHALTNPDYGWQNHPAVRMWRGHERALAHYGIAICDEWIGRGYNDSCLAKIKAVVRRAPKRSAELPDWFSGRKLKLICSSHRSNLLRKDPAWYGQFGWPEPDDIEYVWPV
jgi:hypothetical protein